MNSKVERDRRKKLNEAIAASRPGRKTVLTDAKKEEICSYIALGLSKERATILCGVSKSVFWKYQAQNKEFADMVEKALAKFQAVNLQCIRRASMPRQFDKNGKNVGGDQQWTAAAWLLERRAPEEWGRVDRHLIHTTGGERAVLPHEYKEAIMQALGMRGELKPIGKPPALPPANGSSGNGHRDADVIDLEVLPE